MSKADDYRRNALRHHPPAKIASAPLKVASARSGRHPLLLNVDADAPWVRVTPSLSEIEAVIAECERIWLEHIWANIILSDPDRALARSGPATSILTEYLLHRLGAERISKSPAFQGIEFARATLPTSRQDRISLLGPAPRDEAEALDRFPVNFWLERVRMPPLRPSAAGSKDGLGWLQSFFGLLKHSRAVNFSAAYLRMVACRLVDRGWVLFPLRVAKSIEGGLYGEERNQDTHQYALYYSAAQRRKLNLLASEEDSVADRAFARVCVFCTTFNEPADVSWGFSEDVFRLYRTVVKGRAAPRAWARLKEMARTNGAEALTPKFEDPYMVQVGRLCAASGKDLRPWVIALASYRPTLNVKSISSKFRAIRHVLNWVATLNPPPAPTQITRQHIKSLSDPSQPTLLKYLSEYRYTTPKGEKALEVAGKNAALSEAERFFEWLVESEREKDPQSGFIQPIKFDNDHFRAPSGTRPESTYRDRIPGDILAELQRLLVIRREDGRFAWADWLTEVCQLRVGVDAKMQFCPIYPAIIYLLLRLPLRTHQVRQLDSGELDEMLYDFASRRFQKNPEGIAKREAGVLIASPYAPKGAPATQLDFQVFTNKRLVEEARRAAYTIPFVDDEIEWVIGSVRDWQRCWGAKPTLVNLADDPDRRTDTAQDKLVREQLPEICVLFRHPDMRGIYAPRHNAVRGFWDKVCAKWDAQNRAWIDPKTGAQGRPDKPRLSQPRTYVSRGTATGTFTRAYAKYDLHSLRVAGVSTLIDLGLPLGVVVSIAGHASWVMTMHYYKHDRTMARALLGEVLKEGHMQIHFESVQEKLDEMKHWDGFFMGSNQALEKLRRTGKLYTLTPTGICPGASCADGLPEGNRGFSTHVPGARCELCQFRVYGPPFLPGLIQQLNLLTYTITEAGKKQREIRARLDAAYAGGRRDAAVELRSLDEELEREMELDIVHLVRTTEIVRECRAALQSDKPDALISMSSREEIELVMEPVREFEQLKDIILTSDFVRTKSRVPDEALLKMKDRLITLLVTNGEQPFLAGLPKELTKRATLMFCDLLQKTIPDTDTLERLFAGEVALSALPRAETPIKRAVELMAENLRDKSKHPALTANPNLLLDQPKNKDDRHLLQ